MINGTIERDPRSRTLTESGMQISKTFNPRSDHRNVRLRWRCQRTERLTGGLDYGENTLSNGRGLPKWSYSFVLVPKALELGAHSTP